jgi:hypothetical protein
MEAVGISLIRIHSPLPLQPEIHLERRFVMKTTIILVAVLCMPALAFSATIHVPDDYPTIQEAIDASANGDTIIVKPGTYVENINFLGKAITLRSEFGPEVTKIDGNKRGRVVTCQSSEKPDSVLDGFTITNAKDEYTFEGSGMYNWKSSPMVTRCIFSGNYYGMFNHDSSPTVTHCIFSDNYSIGMKNEVGSLTVTHCTISENYMGIENDDSNITVAHCTFDGNQGDGGMESWGGSLTVTHCTFLNNSASGGYGGGMDCPGVDGMVTHCIFDGNEAGYGGGIGAYGENFTVANCNFYNNWASHDGGGIDSCETVTNCNFYKNSAKQGGAIWGSDLVTNCTFYGNSADIGGGIYGNGTVTNCILWDNQSNQVTSNAVTYCCVQGGYPGTGNIDSDPLFVDPANGDFHLLYSSPCKDTGDNGAVTEPFDFEGDPRIAYGTVDMGADEFYTHLYVTGKKKPGKNIKIKHVGLPGTLPVFLLVSSGVLEPPLPTAWGKFHLQPPWVTFPMMPIPANGVLAYPATVPVTPPAPYDLPMQALIGLNPDSLTNLYVLEVR